MQVGDQIHRLEIVLEALSHAGTDHLHCNLAWSLWRIHNRRMDLGDGGGGDRVAKFPVEFRNRPSERSLDIRFGGCGWEKGHAVLKACEIVRELRAHHIRTGGQKLTHLHIGRSKPLDGHRQPIATLRSFRLATGEWLQQGF